jgi:hypothetical protein
MPVSTEGVGRHEQRESGRPIPASPGQRDPRFRTCPFATGTQHARAARGGAARSQHGATQHCAEDCGEWVIPFEQSLDVRSLGGGCAFPVSPATMGRPNFPRQYPAGGRYRCRGSPRVSITARRNLRDAPRRTLMPRELPFARVPPPSLGLHASHANAPSPVERDRSLLWEGHPATSALAHAF